MEMMTAERGKRRGWIKNAVIVFLAIMLVLTFFSNTIMNRSLPEVATQYVQSGSISAKIRGSGTVTANSAYEVKLKENRVIKTVAVRRGDEVNVGDVLFLLEEGDSTQLQELKDTLEQAQYDYRLLLLSSPYNSSSYSRDIERLKEDIEEAIEKRDLAYVTDEQIESAETAVIDQEFALERLNDDIEELQEQIAELGGVTGGGEGGASGNGAELYDAKRTAEIDRQTAYIIHRATLLTLYDLAMDAIAGTGAQKFPESTDYYFYQKLKTDEIAKMQAKAQILASHVIEEDTGEVDKDGDPIINYISDDSYLTALTAIQSAEKTYQDAVTAHNEYIWNAQGSAMDAANAAAAKAEIERLEDQIKSLEKEKKLVEKALADAKEVLSTLEGYRDSYPALDDAVDAAEDALEDLYDQIRENQQSDAVEQTKYDMDVEKAKREIDELKAEIEKMESGETESSITSPVAGVVTSINISAGSTTEYDVSLMTIEEKDRGYLVSMSVTNEQAQKVKLGDPAEVSGAYWGVDISATLATITNDPANPGRGKLLNFVVEGDVAAGDQLTLAIGEKSRNYELIVPNSAIRSDANGYFVLVLQSKASPLGTRYVANRVDIQKVAEDDQNTAVTGGLVSYDYVITTASAPVESGDLVRLPE
ncbi:MAG: HlyD family efflux transporter periplasmic adaptor subunit [Ruminococcaceae bacterium]|nr:HlyD family efflux transporter periplasmic adaptor subunit [Oscillospiraceae bacterium]